MKKTLLIGIAAVLVVSLAVLGAGCVGGDPIVGEWKTALTDMPVKFNADGTGTFTAEILGFTKDYKLTWKKVEGSKNKYSISTEESLLPLGEYTLSDDGKTLAGPVGLIKV